MHVTTDVLVIGNGIAGLTAALAAAEKGKKVTIAAAGCGTYSIASGCIDLLGQVDGQIVTDPWAAMFKLSSKHPYRLLGQENIQQALDFFLKIVNAEGGFYAPTLDSDNNPINTLVPTSIGTFKPTYLVSESLHNNLFQANSILICSVDGLRETSCKLIHKNLSSHPRLTQAKFATTLLPSPSAHPHRSLTALDLARFVNTEAGYSWLATCLGKYANAYELILLPPICGTTLHHQILTKLQTLLNAKVQEMLSIPPGVGGLRLHDLLMHKAYDLHIRLLENTEIAKAEVVNNKCVKVSTNSPYTNLEITAQAYVLATGGILGGGLKLSPTEALEPIFQIKQLLSPQDLSVEDIFQPQPIAQIGLQCDQQLHLLSNAEGDRLDNVFLAGKIIANYDYAAEKSGHGVAIATGYLAGTLAASNVQ